MDVTAVLLLIGKIAAAYKLAIAPVYKQYKLSKTAFDVLIYIGNHPGVTAKEICDNRGLKANLVSMSVDKLVDIGYVQRCQQTDDKRCVELCCTPKAQPLIEQAGHIQRSFWKNAKSKLSEVEKSVVDKFVDVIQNNADILTKPDIKGENI